MPQPLYTIREEIVHSISHGIGTLLSVTGLVTLTVIAALFGNSRQLVSVMVYGLSLVLLYLASTLYHAIQVPRIKKVFQIMDHSAIYLLIAGTYTPFLLISLEGAQGLSLLVIIWALAFFGIGFKAFYIDRFHRISTIGYLLMGWLGVLGGKQVLAAIPNPSLYWLAAGGVIYTAGIVFLAWRRIPYNHAIWHLFVLVGSICHFFAVFNLLPIS